MGKIIEVRLHSMLNRILDQFRPRIKDENGEPIIFENRLKPFKLTDITPVDWSKMDISREMHLLGFMTAKELAADLGCSESTIRRRAEKGYIIVWKDGRRCWYKNPTTDILKGE